MRNVLNLVIEVMPEKFLNYLPVTVITNLLFASMYTRAVIFKKFKDILFEYWFYFRETLVFYSSKNSSRFMGSSAE